jgi:DNA-binding NarL/FixJ family response regulator
MMQTHTGAVKMVRLVEQSTPPIKVLIIEGHPAVRDALYKRLSATPQLDIIESVDDVPAALSWMTTTDIPIDPHHSPDVIVLGLQNGTDADLLDMVHEVRSLTQYPAAVVVLAPYADEVERVLLQTAGVKRYLLKHINSQQLIREIQKAATEGVGRAG